MLFSFLRRRKLTCDSGTKPRIWLYADMEGINNITQWDEVDPRAALFHRGSSFMTEEVNSVVKGLVAGGARDVLINDIHWFYNNIIWKKMDKHAVYCGNQGFNLPYFFSQSFEAVVIVGMHAKANTEHAILPHTWYLPSYIEALQFNQKFIGEIDLIKFIADEKGVPVLLLTGDRAGCLEAAESISGIVTVMTKEKQWEKVQLMPRKEANRLVRQKSTEVIQRFRNNPSLFKQDVLKRPEPLNAIFALKKIADRIESRCQHQDIPHKRLNRKTIQFCGRWFSENLKQFMSVLD